MSCNLKTITRTKNHQFNVEILKTEKAQSEFNCCLKLNNIKQNYIQLHKV